MPIRVYEFAKQQGITNKEILDILQDGGFDVHSHMAVLEQDAIDFLQKKLKPAVVEKKSAPKATALAPNPVKKEEPNMEVATSKQVVKNNQPAPVAPKARVDAAVKPDFKKTASAPVVTSIVVKPMTVSEFAIAVQKPVTEVILTLLKNGQVSAKNQLLSQETVAQIARQYGLELIEPVKEVVQETQLKKGVSAGGQLQERLPIVVVVGHVDHGKTTLLDFIRKTRVASREKGGITQHLGAYEATTPQGSIVFLDTPGHEAFSKIRVRGVKVADIAILVVAADDGIMPQTVEAIKAIKAMEAPVIVAINKMDKVEPSRIETIKRGLSQHGLQPEDWGGDVVCVPISAKLGQGIDQLLEMIILQSQMMELKADATGFAKGYVLESKLEKGRGPVATIICLQGTLSVGDNFVCGNTTGKVSSIIDSAGKRLQKVLPSIPVLVAGFSVLPEAGDSFEAIPAEELRKARMAIEGRSAAAQKTTSTKDTINIIIKTDSNSSKEALVGSIAKLNKKLEKGFNVINASVGNINESDVTLASTTGAMMLTLHTKTEPNAQALAQKLKVSIKSFDIIYKLLEDLEAFSEGTKEVKMIKTKIGEATVLKVFDIKGLGVIAGAYMKEGRFTKDGTVVVIRGGRKVGEGAIKSLQRDRKAVKEVHTGFECAFMVDGFDAWEPDDRVECYIEVAEGSK